MVDLFNQFKDFKSFEVVFRRGEGPQKIYCTVRSIENNRIIIDANNQKNNNVIASVGDELQLHIYTENGVYSANSKVLLVDKGLLNTEYSIIYPTNSKYSQRREYFRADMPINFKMSVITDENTNEGFEIESVTRNICGKGMSYISNKPFPEYSSIKIVLDFKEKVINTTALLVYSKQMLIDGLPKLVHAFTFTEISQRNIDYIVKKCFLYQLDLRKNKTIK